MVSHWKFPSIKALEIRVASFRTVFFTTLAAVFIFYGILHYFALMFMILSWSYIFMAWIFAFIRKLAGRKSKTLQEFETDLEDLPDGSFE